MDIRVNGGNMNTLSFFVHIITRCSPKTIVLLLKCLSRFFYEYSPKNGTKELILQHIFSVKETAKSVHITRIGG